MFKDENLDWRGSEQNKDFWYEYAKLDLIGRRNTLSINGLQYDNVPRCKKCNKAYYKCICDNPKELKRIKKMRKELEEKMNKPFKEKLRDTKALVKQVIAEQKGKKIYLAYSGGIDSECCVQLFKSYIAKGLVTVVIGDTLVEFPETRARWTELQKEIPTGKFIIARPQLHTSFKTVTQKYGLPIYSRGAGKLEEREPTKKCCYFLKKLPMKIMTKDAEVLIMGLRREENQYRSMIIFRMGNYFYSKALKMWRVYPIAFWTIKDVWGFQKLRRFKYNIIYDKNDKTAGDKTGFFKTEFGQNYQIRTGCWCCPQSIKGGYPEWLQKYYPKFYDALVNKLGLKTHIVWAQIEAKKAKIKQRKQQPCGEPL